MDKSFLDSRIVVFGKGYYGYLGEIINLSKQ